MLRLLKNIALKRIAGIARNILGLSLCVLTVSCGGGGGSSGGSDPAISPIDLSTPLNGSITTDTVVASAATGASYPISVYVPADYATTTDYLRVIYILDGGADNGDRLPNLAKITEQHGLRAVLIGIGGYARREIDCELAGARDFYAFITTELIPFIESKYRIDPNARTLAGHSLGGLFAVVALVMDRPDHRYFANYISQCTSTWGEEPQLFDMEQKLFTESAGNLPGTTLVLSGDVLGNDFWVERVYQRFLARHYQGLQLLRIPG